MKLHTCVHLISKKQAKQDMEGEKEEATKEQINDHERLQEAKNEDE
jgi:hypothetical protein